jgi:hypothetical protein
MRYDKRGNGSKTLLYLNNTCKKCDSEIQNKNYFAHKDDNDFKENWLKKSREYYHNNKALISEKMKVKRQTPEYKEMMRLYRAKNKEKIFKQEVVTKKRYQQKHRDGLTDEYVIRQLVNQEIADRDMLKIHPEIIEAKRLQLLIIRKTKQNAN